MRYGNRVSLLKSRITAMLIDVDSFRHLDLGRSSPFSHVYMILFEELLVNLWFCRDILTCFLIVLLAILQRSILLS